MSGTCTGSVHTREGYLPTNRVREAYTQGCIPTMVPGRHIGEVSHLGSWEVYRGIPPRVLGGIYGRFIPQRVLGGI